jgi:nucleoside 2-deoxyribosyltransferase
MKVYIAAHCRWAACHVADVLKKDHEISSTWHQFEFNKTESHDESTRAKLATIDRNEIAESDALVLVSGPDRYPGGKFVEAGIAIGLGKRVIVIGRRENMLLLLPGIDCVNEPIDASELLTRKATP